MTHGLLSTYELLLAHFGPRHWWPSDSPMETAVGAAAGDLLKPGDVVEACIEGIGTLLNPVIADGGPDTATFAVE